MVSTRDKKPIYVGAGATLVVTGMFLALPYVLPVAEIRTLIWEWTGELPSENPFTVLVIFGGVIGGCVAGYLTARKWDSNMTNGVYAALYGIVWLYVLYVMANAVYWIIIVGTSPIPVYNVVVFPLVYLLPLLVIHFFGGMVGGLFGGWLASILGTTQATLPE